LNTVKEKLIAADDRMRDSTGGSRSSGGHVNYADGGRIGRKEGSGGDSRRCHNCGKVGHISKHCRQKTSNDDKGERKCYECSQAGHNAKRETTWRSPGTDPYVRIRTYVRTYGRIAAHAVTPSRGQPQMTRSVRTDVRSPYVSDPHCFNPGNSQPDGRKH
jgi:hypothetical protein